MEEQIRIHTTEINTQSNQEEQIKINPMLNQSMILGNEQLNVTGVDEQQEQMAQPQSFFAQFTQAAATLQDDTSRSSDSFEMKAVKREVQRLRLMQENAKPEELIAQFQWMETVLRDKYLKPRQKSDGSMSNRHRKVKAILDLVKAEKNRIKNREDYKRTDVLKIEHRNTERLADKLCRSNKDAAKNKAALKNLLAKDVPMQEQKFATEKGKILLAYDALISDFRSIANSYCITESAKQNRLDAERVILQLNREKKIYAKAVFKNFAKSHYRTWEEDLSIKSEKPVTRLNRAELTQQKNLFVETNEEGQKADAATQMFFRLVGASKLCRSTEKAELEDGENAQKSGLVIHKGERLFTHEAAINLSRETGKNLSYSYEALSQLATIQIIDMICGQKNRRPDSFVYKLKEQEIEEESYLMIESVKVTDNTLSFGTETFDELNRNSGEEEEICTKRLVGQRGTITVAAYDEKVADSILSLDPELMRTYFSAIGLEEEKVNALTERLQKVQTALEKDKRKGLRAQMQQAPNREEKERAVEDSYYQNNCFVGYQGLLRDRGTAKEGPMRDINDRAQTDLVSSNALSMQKTARIKESVTNDLQNKFGNEALQEDTEKILKAISKYTNISQDRERYQSEWGRPLIRFLSLYRPKLLNTMRRKVEEENVPEEQRDQEIERRLIAKYGNRDEIMNREEEETLEKLRPKLDVRIGTLQSRAGELSEQEQTELEKLTDYRRELFGECGGALEIPANASVKYVSDRTGFKRDITWKKKDQTPLFCHEPRLSDLNQGEVGDCYFVSTLGAIVNREPSLIKQNMKDNGDGTVTVRFYKPALIGNPKPVYVKVDKSIAGGEENYKNGLCGAMWAKLYEKAFVASGLVKNRWFSRYAYSDIEAQTNEDAALWITGRKARELFFISDTKSYKKMREDNSRTTRRFNEHVARVKTLLQEATNQKKILMGGTFKEFQTVTGTTERGERKFRGLRSQHSYTILGLVKIDGKDFVQIRNPGGKDTADLIRNETTGNFTYREATFRTGAFYLDLNMFCRFFRSLHAVNSAAPAV